MDPLRTEGFEFSIRKAVEEDVPAIADIYNDAVLTTVATFDTEPRSIDDRLVWFAHHDEQFPVLAAVTADEVLGWASLSRWSDKKAYDCTAEFSLYVARKARGHGIGGALFAETLRRAKENGLHSIISRIAEGNDVSIALHEKYGFFRVGVLKEVGFKFGKLLDVIILQKIL